jgi:hypothetical protein
MMALQRIPAFPDEKTRHPPAPAPSRLIEREIAVDAAW